MIRYSFVQVKETAVQETLDMMSETGWELMQMNMPLNPNNPYRLLFKKGNLTRWGSDLITETHG